ncbi:MAG: hypothetical protein U0R49_10885 [Fimbriimonadales bacterium]
MIAPLLLFSLWLWPSTPRYIPVGAHRFPNGNSLEVVAVLPERISGLDFALVLRARAARYKHDRSGLALTKTTMYSNGTMYVSARLFSTGQHHVRLLVQDNRSLLQIRISDKFAWNTIATPWGSDAVIEKCIGRTASVLVYEDAEGTTRDGRPKRVEVRYSWSPKRQDWVRHVLR